MQSFQFAFKDRKGLLRQPGRKNDQVQSAKPYRERILVLITLKFLKVEPYGKL